MVEQNTANGSQTSFLEKLFSVFSSGNGPEREKKRLLKIIAKQLKNDRRKYYKPKGEEVLPSFAAFFHFIYKLVGPAGLFLEKASESGGLKSIIIESYLNPSEREIIEDLREESIRKRAETENLKDIVDDLKQKLVSFFSAFNSRKVAEINQIYNLLLTFLKFIDFDYYFLLKKFDSNLPERDFFYNPRFEAIPGNYITDDLKDFLEVLMALEASAPWDRLFEILKIYKGQDIINTVEWQKLLRTLQGIKKSSIFVLIIRHIDKNPYFKPLVNSQNKKIVEPYLTKQKTQTELIIQKIIREKKNRKIDKMAEAVFGTAAISRMKFYNEKMNIAFSKKMLGGFIYIVPLNYLKAFLLDFVKRDIKEIVDLLLIKGQWSTNIMSQKLSESFQQLLEISDNLIALDESLSEEGETGSRIKVLLPRIDRDMPSLTQLKQIIKETNENAKIILNNALNSLITLGKNINTVLNDHGNQPHEVLVNWKDLGIATEGKICPSLKKVYTKIYYFIQLEQNFTR